MADSSQLHSKNNSVLHATICLAELSVLLTVPGAVFAQTALQHVANNAALQALSTVSYQTLVRDAFAVTGDSPPNTFSASSAACTLNAGAGDGITQVPSSNGRCWIAVQSIGDIRSAGATVSASAAVNGTALTNTYAAFADALIPKGAFTTNIQSNSMPARFGGPGTILDVSSNKRGPKFGAIYATPSSLGNYNSVETAFNGDWSHGGGEEYRIYGTATLGQPNGSSGQNYVYTPEASPHYLYLYNESGWNQSTTGNSGRTAATGYRIQSYQNGQGDIINFNGSCFVAGGKPGATNFLANPACVLFAGDTFAGADGVYLNPVEINLIDQGHDAAGVGAVYNLVRTNNTGTLGVFWAGVRLQSTGSVAVDTAWSAVGKYNFGLDFSAANFGSNQAAITTTLGQRWYGNAVNTDPNVRYPTSLGSDWISDDSSINGWNVVVSGGSRLQINANQVSSLPPLKAMHFGSLTALGGFTPASATFLGTGATVSCTSGHACDDVSGVFTVTTGSGTLAKGPALTLTWGIARSQTPSCIVQLQQGTDTPLLVAKVEATSGLTFYPGAALAPSTAYSLTYQCMGT
jgi:hypothetical protein